MLQLFAPEAVAAVPRVGGCGPSVAPSGPLWGIHSVVDEIAGIEAARIEDVAGHLTAVQEPWLGAMASGPIGRPSVAVDAARLKGIVGPRPAALAAETARVEDLAGHPGWGLWPLARGLSPPGLGRWA